MATETTAPSSTAAAAPRIRRISRRPLLFIILAVAVVGAIGYGYTYWRDATLYISTDDALVDTTMQTVASPGPGTLVSWQAQAGAHVTAGQVLGIVRTTPGLSSATSFNVLAPIDGMLIRVDAHQGQIVAPSLALAYVADLDHLWVTAFIDETEIHNVQIGQPVDITVDATGRASYQGTVSAIIPATASEFALLPSSDRSTGNFTKVTQRVEVRIALNASAAGQLYPGENANVRIHR